MDIAKAKAHQLDKKPVPASFAGGGASAADVVLFGPLEVQREELLEDLLWLHGLSHAGDFETAIAVSWHKISDKNGMARMSKIVNLHRMSMDGRSRPPFNFSHEYRFISDAPDLSFSPKK